MDVRRFEIDGLVMVKPRRFGDERGWFSETWNAEKHAEAGIAGPFVQDNQSLSRVQGTVRGLHFQLQPAAQGKLVRVIRGRILDVAVDLREGSATYGRHVAVELDAEEGWQLWVPVGFAHGFCTLVPDTEIAYKVTAPYSPAHDRGLLWNDPALGIPWPDFAGAVLSDKDGKLPILAEVGNPFPR
ncbi:dTDP-4-dehydrorhamnose 3,5-epimerase [Nitrospirillum iridis]|uniref:dTDP-4-dehydrorhamnose 3,5-epimerase n=1 Tax=Nitrospirillum iridis TaxID=765888 RepID=A0A7X0EH66_9PROT|nr:dTDP-4-dehydrorhamnose 3,5-epimerase [Nitrospirillum iridis]MBB6254821.1 dTDP-4-dehydrorhamnose 3,5-epimerase [Nitrospirillum iridis]